MRLQTREKWAEVLQPTIKGQGNVKDLIVIALLGKQKDDDEDNAKSGMLVNTIEGRLYVKALGDSQNVKPYSQTTPDLLVVIW